MSLFTVESTEAHVPVTTKTAHDPALVSLFAETLKPRGIPTPDGQAVKITTPTKDAANAVIAGLRALRDEETDEQFIREEEKDGKKVKVVTYSTRARVTPTDKENKEGPQSVVLWLDNRITRVRKPKDTETSTTLNTSANLAAADVPAENADSDALDAARANETPAAETPAFVEPVAEESHKRRFGR